MANDSLVAGGPPRSRWQWVRLVGNAVNLSTPAGVAVAVAGRAAIRRGPRGLLLADGYRLGFPYATAFTVGSVLITSQPDWTAYARRAPGVLAHEERHTWQWLVCGPAFLPAYTVAMAWSWLRTGDRAAANLFERHAGLALGGYRDLPRRSLGAGFAALVSSVLSRRRGRSRAGAPTGRAGAAPAGGGAA